MMGCWLGGMVFLCLLAPAQERKGLEFPPPTTTVGVIKKVEEERTALLIKVRGKTLRVPLDLHPKVVVTKHKAVPLRKLPGGTGLWVLGRRQESQRVPGSAGTFPPQIVQIAAVVAGPFEVRGLSKEAKKRKLVWISGSLQRGKNEIRLDETNMQLGSERLVTVVEKAKKEALKKKQRVYVVGHLKEKMRPKELHPRSIAILSPKIPAREYSFILQ
ncbi:MAG: hypothetical protein ACE5GW_11200 [Planctomycetota bacterium]